MGTEHSDAVQDHLRAWSILIWVQSAILYTRSASADATGASEQVDGSRKPEIAWTIIPAVILLVLFIPNAQAIFKHAAAEQGPDKFDIDVIGNSGGGSSGTAISHGSEHPKPVPLVTANEALIPVGADVLFHVTSKNVVLLFRLPAAQRQVDVIRGHDNPMQFVASTPGDISASALSPAGPLMPGRGSR